MRQNLMRRLQAFFSPASFPLIRKKRRKPRLESLEERVTPTATLYYDFGDRYPSSGLTGTIGDLVTLTHDNNPAVNGPDLSFFWSSSDTFQLKNFKASHKGNNAADATARAAVMEQVRRHYAPFDVTVVELTDQFQTVNGHQVRGASTLDDISDILGANEGDTKNNDTYILMGAMTIGAFDENPKDFGLLGISNGTDLVGFPTGTGANLTDGTVLCFMDASGDYYESIVQLAYTASHEAGHSFGLTHGLTFNVPAGADPQLPYFELMSYFDINGYRGFSRYPQVEGNSNTDPNSLNSELGQDTVYNQFAFDAEMGASPTTEYITGTGAHNIITVSKTSATTASVSVQAFSTANFTGPITVPKLGGTTYSYTIDLTKPELLIYTGPQNDRLILDGDLGVNVRIFGMGGTDELVINGNNADSASYTPSAYNTNGHDGQQDRRGAFTLQTGQATTTIDFREFETTSPITIQNVKALTFTTPGGVDNLTIGNGPAGSTTFTGTMAGAGFIPIRIRSVGEFILNAGNNDTDTAADVIIIKDSTATNISRGITVLTGAGNDVLRIQAGNLGNAATGAVTFDAGDGNDSLEVSAATLTLPGGGLRFLGGGGNDTFDTDLSSINLPGASTNPGLTFDGGDGDDVLTFNADSVSLPAGGLIFNAGDGDDSLTLGSITLPATGTGPGFTFNAGAGNDTLNLSADTLTLPAGGFIFNGGDGDDTFDTTLTGVILPDNATGPGFTFNGDAGNDILIMRAASISLPPGGFVFSGGDGDDSMTAAFNTVIVEGGSTGPIFIFDAGEGNDSLALTGNALALPANGFVYTAGNGNDRLELAAPSPFANLPAGLLTAGNLFDGGAGDDVLALTAATLALPSAGFIFTGDDGNDTLEIWATQINAGAGGLNPTFSFAGGGGDDLLILKGNVLLLNGGGFVFTGGAGGDRLEAAFSNITIAVNGPAFQFDAGTGDDVLELTATTLSLPAGAFVYNAGANDDTFVASFTTLNVAGGGQLVFSGEDGNDFMNLTAANLTLPANAFLFDGGAGNDALSVGFAVILGGTGTAFSFVGGAGSDSLTATGAAARAWLISGVNTGTMNSRLTFQGIEALTSGDGDDLFQFTAVGRFNGPLNAGAGLDTINLNNFANVSFALTAANANGGFNATYGGPLTGNIQSINRVVVGASTQDVLTGVAAGGTWGVTATGSSYTGAGNQLTFSGFNVLRGGNGADVLVVNFAAGSPVLATGLRFDGGAGNDTLRVVGSAAADSFLVGFNTVTVNGRTVTFANGEAVSLLGGAGNDVFKASSVSMAFRALEMRGDAGGDTFTVAPSTSTVISVHGDAPTTRTGGDVLVLSRGNIQFAGARPAKTATAGTFAFVGRLAVLFTGIERYDAGGSLISPD